MLLSVAKWICMWPALRGEQGLGDGSAPRLGSRGCPQLPPAARDNSLCLCLTQEQDLAPQAAKSQLLLSLEAVSLDLNARFFFGDLIFEMLGIKSKDRQIVTFDFGGKAGGFFRYVCFYGSPKPNTHLVSVLVWSVFAAGSVVYLSKNSV